MHVIFPSYQKHFAFSAGLLLGIFILLNATEAWGVSCSEVFTSAAQIHSPNGEIRIGYQGRISGGSTQLTSPALADQSQWASCTTEACTASGTSATRASVAIKGTSAADGAISTPFRSTRSFSEGHYSSVSVGQESTLQFTTVDGDYRMGAFTTGYQSQVYFAPGDYWINGDLIIGNDVQLHLTDSGPVRIFVSGQVTINHIARTTNTDSARLLIYAKGDIDIGGKRANRNYFTSFFYSENGSITLSFRSTVYGGLSAATQIILDNETRVNYDETALASADFGALCGFTGPQFSHWALDIGSGSASTCAPHRVTLSARDSEDNLLPDYTGTVTLATSTQRGNWSKTDTPTDARGELTAGANNSGEASYTFATDGSDQGQVTLLLANSQAQTLRVTATEPDAGVTSQSEFLTFAENAFTIVSTDPLAEDVIAGRSHSLQVQMLRRDPVTGTCGPAPEYQNSGLQVWLSRGAADPGGAAPVLTSSDGSTEPPDTAPGSNNFTIAFTAGIANFSLLASDVGQYALVIRDASQTFSDTPIDGGSTTLVARPFGFAIEVEGNPAAKHAGEAIFQPAGENFPVKVTAVAWQAADDNDNDGWPDGHTDSNPENRADLSDNPAVTHFGGETPPAAVRLSASLLAPTGGSNPGLANGNTAGNDGRLLTQFSNGVALTDQVYYPEVGIVQLAAQLDGQDYLGIGAAIASRSNSASGYVGRFTPDYFEVTAGEIEPTCSELLPYSYMAQPFTINWSIEARNSRGAITNNYGGDFNKLQTVQSAIQLRAIDQVEPTALNERISHQSQTAWSSGMTEVISETTFARAAAQDGPFGQLDVGVRVEDIDGVTVQPTAQNLDTNNDGNADAILLGQTALRFGRLRLADAYGPETTELPVIMQTEYWRNDHWSLNHDDSCTTLDLSAIAYNGATIATSANRSVNIGAGTTTGQYANIDSARVRLQSGSAGHSFTAPGTGNTGALEVDINLTNYPWLRYDWNGDGDYSDTALPTATMTFGIYRGHDRVIYWREVLQ